MSDGLESITKEEETFLQVYTDKLKTLQSLADAKEDIVYTKIPMTYAVLNKLMILNLAFHPLSLSNRKSFETPISNSTAIKKTIEEIIVFETTKNKTFLTSEELAKVIKHFRGLEKKA